MNGTYALFIRFGRTVTVSVGALGEMTFPDGEYCYIGSAMNGLEHRIRRHMSPTKKMRWHIDRLTVLADHAEAYISQSADECGLRAVAGECGMRPAAEGFGCSDCGCDTHLMISCGPSKAEFVTAAGLTFFEP